MGDHHYELNFFGGNSYSQELTVIIVSYFV